MGDVLFDVATHDLRSTKGGRIELRHKSSAVLAHLAKHPGDIVSKADLMEAVWPDVTVSDESLTQCIADIRRAIGDTDQSLIETHVGKGYSLTVTPTAKRRLHLAAVGVVVLAVAVFAYSWMSQTEPRPASPPRIAVLAFDDLSAGEDKGWLSDAIAEGVITELSRYNEFRVIARNSSFSFRDTAQGISEIAAALNADFIVEGSKQKSGERLRVTVQLINGQDGTHIWAHEYTEDLGELFEIQSRVVRSIATQIGYELAWKPSKAGGRQAIDALHFYFLGNEAFSQSSPASSRKAIDFYQASIEADPDAPYGYIGMATIVWHDLLQGWVYGDVPYDDLLQRGIDYADAAIAADPTNYASHIARGDLHFSAGELENAIIRYEAALKLNPSSSVAMAVATDPLLYLDRTDEAIELMERAIDLNPIVPGWYYNNLSRAYWDAGRCEEGKETIKERAKFREWDFRALIVNLVCLGEMEEARKAGKDLLAVRPDFTVSGHAKRVAKAMANQDYFDRWMQSLRAAGLPE